MTGVAQITAAELAERANGPRPLLIEFIKSDCSWCERLKPELVRIADEWTDTLDVVSTQVDDEPALVTEYGIRGTPTLVLLRDGVRLGSKHGFQRAQQLRAFLSHHLA